jgi:hypothetical protein
MAGIERGCFNRAILNGRSQFSKGRKTLNNAAGWIDYNRNAIVRAPDEKPAILCGSHPREQQVLPPRFGVPEISIVRQVNQDVCTLPGKLADQVGEGGFITDENTEFVPGGRKNLDIVARNEIAGFLCHAIHE